MGGLMGGLRGETVSRPDLSASDRDRMHLLLAESFAGATRDVFEADLAAKDWVLLLRGTGDGILRGFTTIALMAAEVQGRAVRALFSGDTIIQPAFWGETELPRVWMRFARGVLHSVPDQPLFWFLICMGYKTYRFLPLYTREYYPRAGRATPSFEQNVLDALARQRFPDEYDAAAGVIRPRGPHYRLREGVSDITERRLRNPSVRFFVERNPGHGAGDELACIASLAEENLTPIAVRIRDAHAG